MSDETKPYDPWEVTGLDVAHYNTPNNKSGQHWMDGFQAVIDRVRVRVEAYQAAAGSAVKSATEPTWVKIGDVAVPTARIVKFKRYPSGVVIRVDGESMDVYGSDADALWAHVTHPVRCVDLTPEKDGNA